MLLLVLLQAPKNLVLRAPPKHKHAMNTGISLLFAPFLPDKEHGGSHYLAEIVERYNSSFFSRITTSDAVQAYSCGICKDAVLQGRIFRLFCTFFAAQRSRRETSYPTEIVDQRSFYSTSLFAGFSGFRRAELLNNKTRMIL